MIYLIDLVYSRRSLSLNTAFNYFFPNRFIFNFEINFKAYVLLVYLFLTLLTMPKEPFPSSVNVSNESIVSF